jgi:beta-glucosidase
MTMSDPHAELSESPPPLTGADSDKSVAERVAVVVAGLSRHERVAVALGDFACLVERGLPVPHYVDSGTGLRDVPGATAFPAGIALAAAFDPVLAGEYGRAVGAEARAAGFTVVLGPTLDLARDPRAGRIPEALGEDPYLSGLLGAAHVRGLQSTHLIAQLKHFVAYNGEDRRTGYGLGEARGDAIDVRVSAAVLQDVYLRPFRAAIEAGAWSMMGSYNRINGRYACESPEVLAIPREQWGWPGFFCPDFLFAVRDDAEALAAGLDLGALGGPGGRTRELVEAAGDDVVESLVTNLVRALIGSGLADDPPRGPLGDREPLVGPVETPSRPEHRHLAERTAIAATVLLKNDAHALPFGPDVRSLAVIGPSGADALFVVGGSAAVDPGPGRLVTPVEGIRARLTAPLTGSAQPLVGSPQPLVEPVETRLHIAQGSLGDVPLPTVPAEAFTLPDGSGPGVEVEFVDASGHAWTEVLPDIDHAVAPTDPAARWPRRWRTLLTSGVTGRHRLSLGIGGRATLSLDGERLLVGAREAEQFIHGPHYPLQAVVDLTAGRPVLLEIAYEPGPAIVIPPMGIGPSVRLGWQPPDGLIDGAVVAAAGCDAAVVLVNQACGEGMDRDGLALPGDQDELVRRVAAANPRTTVVLNTPGAVLMPWLDEVAAVLQVWYPGERFGSALAAVLFGDAEPGGRLPLTFPLAREHLPGGDHGPETVPTRLDYDADGGIGYRAPGVREHGALFPFGHGLGYAPTTAAVRGVEVVDGALAVTLRVTNHGARDTIHVAQLYADVSEGAPELVAIARVPLGAGTTASAHVVVGAEAFARWDAVAGRRRPVPGVHQLLVGTSSAAVESRISVTADHQRIIAGELLE